MRYFFHAIKLYFVIASSFVLANNSAAAQSGSQQQFLKFKLPSKKHFSVAVERDATVAKNATPQKIRIIGTIKDVAVVLVDTYRSIPGGMSYCQAGHESFLRIISLTSRNPVETFHVKLTSCRDNIELASPGIKWRPKSSTIVVHWLQGPDKNGKPETQILHIDKQGKVNQ